MCGIRMHSAMTVELLGVGYIQQHWKWINLHNVDLNEKYAASENDTRMHSASRMKMLQLPQNSWNLKMKPVGCDVDQIGNATHK